MARSPDPLTRFFCPRQRSQIPVTLHPLPIAGQRGTVAKKETVIEIEGKTLKLSNLDKVLYPAVGFTKGQVIDYFVRIAPVLLPHLKDRPLTLKRYPERSEERRVGKECRSEKAPDECK